MLQIYKGDILYANTAFICHQVNCMNAMGSGVAKAICTKYPEVKTMYHEFCSTAKTPNELLGEIQIVPLHEVDMAVINIFGQLDYGRCKGRVYTDYDALQKAFAEINKQCAGKSITFPYGFGCGLAGGDWVTVENLMLNYLWNCNVKIYMKE